MIYKSDVVVIEPAKSMPFQFDEFFTQGCINCNEYSWLISRNKSEVFYECKYCNINIGLYYMEHYMEQFRHVFCFIKKDATHISFSYKNIINIYHENWVSCLKSIQCSSNQEVIDHLKNNHDLFKIYKKLIVLK